MNWQPTRKVPAPSASQLADALRRSIHGPAWHGPALIECITGVDARIAARTPIAGGHSIWQLVLHMAYWAELVRRQLSQPLTKSEDSENFPTVTDTSEVAWGAAQKRLIDSHMQLADIIEQMSQDDLAETALGREDPRWVMVQGIAEHAAYHGGQIALLRRAAGIAPPVS